MVKYNWKEIQKFYDEGNSCRDITRKFGINSSSIQKAKKRKDIICRNISDGVKLWSSKRQSPGQASTKEKEDIRRKKLSKIAKLNKLGGYVRGSGRSKKTKYGEVFLDSSYELAFAKWMDLNKIKWKKNYVKFPYTYESKLKYYIPDFYLSDLDIYVEVKGYYTLKDLEKWKVFPYELKVIFGEDLYKNNLIKKSKYKQQNLEDASQWRVTSFEGLGRLIA